MEGTRYLVVNADDFGIGPATSQGILELASAGLITSTVLLVNSPHAGDAVRRWRQGGPPVELGWHPCLTLDRPLLPAAQVASLVDKEGRFHRLSSFLARLATGRIVTGEVEAELTAQHGRFQDLVGNPPSVVNSHHHLQVFPRISRVLLRILGRQKHLPYVRRIEEPWRMIARISGARAKRAFLSHFGARDAARQRRLGFPGNDSLIGITNPPCVARASFLTRWLAKVPGKVVELTCHPGHWDSTLIDRDCRTGDGQLLRRVQEMHLLRDPRFREAVHEAGFLMVSPSAWAKQRIPGFINAA
ncbi:MAG: carbohydrate deacetylase [Gemmataceae bacterium]